MMKSTIRSGLETESKVVDQIGECIGVSGDGLTRDDLAFSEAMFEEADGKD